MSDSTLQNAKLGTERFSGAAAQQSAEAFRHGTEAVQQSSAATSEAMRRAAEATAEAVQRSSAASADAMQRVGTVARETMRQGAEAFVGTQRQLSQKAAEQFNEMSRKVAQAAQGSTAGMRAFTTFPTSGMHDLQHSMAGLVEGVVRTNIRATQELFQLANPGAYVEFQQRFMREYMDTLMTGTTTVLMAARRTADEALRTSQQQLGQRTQTVQAGHTPAE